VFHAIAEAVLQHQTGLFAVTGAIVAALLVLGARALGRLELFSDLTHGEVAGGAAKRADPRILIAAVVVVAGVGLGAFYGRSDPIALTTLLGMPDLTCDHRGTSLLVFLHGWRGDREETWHQFPDLVCGDYEFRDSDVLSIGYPVYLIGSNLTTEQFGAWLADKLAANNLERYKKIAIIGHSLGGLLARRLVLEQRQELGNIGLLIEIGTPHLGPYSYTALADNVLFRGGQLVGELQTGSAFLQRLDADWQKLPKRPRTYCTGSPNDLVVSLESAQHGCDEKHFYPALGHIDMVKPTSIRDDRYRIPMYTVGQYFD
jgi:triacylglycerol esterase/lipase EstA (alpha/beta hydrolase family)